MILPRIITICKHTLALVTLLAIWRQNNSWQLGKWWTHLKARHVVLHPSLDFVRIDAATMVNIHCVQQIERDIVRDCEPKLGLSCDHLLFG